MKPWALCAAACLAWSASSARAEGIPTATEYSAGIHTARVALDASARSGTPRFSPHDPAVLELHRLAQVRLADGRILTTDTPELIPSLESQSPADVRAAIREIDALDDDLRPGTRTGAGTAVQQSKLAAVLSGPQFHLQKSVVEQIQDRLSSAYEAILQALFGRLASSPPLQILIAVLFLVTVGGVALLLSRSALRVMTAEPPARAVNDQPNNAAEARRHADERAAAGDFRSAIRYLFLATLLELQDVGALQLAPGKTNREYLRSVRESLHPSPHLNDEFLDLVDTFDRVWYGHAPFTAEDYQRCRNLAENAIQEARRSAAA